MKISVATDFVGHLQYIINMLAYQVIVNANKHLLMSIASYDVVFFAQKVA